MKFRILSSRRFSNIFLKMDRLLKFCSRLAMATMCEHSFIWKFGIIFSKFYWNFEILEIKFLWKLPAIRYAHTCNVIDFLSWKLHTNFWLLEYCNVLRKFYDFCGSSHIYIKIELLFCCQIESMKITPWLLYILQKVCLFLNCVNISLL